MNRPIKHMAKNLAAAVLIAAAAMSCTVGTAVLETDGNTKSAITFSAFTSTMPTKGAINAPDTILGYWDATASKYVAGKGIGVFAFHQPAKSNGYPVDFNSHTGEPTFMYNQKVERTSTDGTNFTFNYTPQKYWPNNENDQLSFFAYAPYDPATAWEDLGMVANLKGTKITRHYEIEKDVEDQTDFVWANPVLNQKKPAIASSIEFAFEHICARLGITAVADVDDDNFYTTIDKVVISGYFNMEADMIYLPETDTHSLNDIERSEKVVNFVPVKNASHRVTTTEGYVNDSEHFVFPLPGTQDITLAVTVSQHNTQNGNTFTGVVEKTFPSMELQSGKGYNFKIEIHLDEIEIGSISFDSWPSEQTKPNIP